MPTLNVILLVGNLTRDPEVRYSPNGTSVATLVLVSGAKVLTLRSSAILRVRPRLFVRREPDVTRPL
jgi:hypothetical protein